MATPALAAPIQPLTVAQAVPASPLAPSVKNGVELWRAGDYAGAVAMWQPYANGGDADAMFNIGQAYKLGRAVPKDAVAARDWYRKAALKGHLPAQANLGILLFQAGEKAEAVRWLKAAADKNEMRAQYVLGVASWNGDGVPRSMTLAYGYLARASAQGLPEATTALNNLTGIISPVERANGWAVATSLAANNGVPTMFVPGGSRAMASADTLNRDQVIKPAPRPVVVAAQPPVSPPLPQKPVAEVAGIVAPTVPAPAAQSPVVPQVGRPAIVPPAAATAAAVVPAPATSPVAVAGAVPPRPAVATPPVTVASAAPSRPSPAAIPSPNPGSTATRPMAPAVASVAIPASTPVAQASVAPTSPRPVPALAPKPVEAAVALPKPVAKNAAKPVAVAEAKLAPKPSGWRIQLGAFSKKTLAEAAWTDVKAKQKQLVGAQKPIYEADGSVTKLQMGPYTTKVAARDACAKIAFTGRACFVTES